jgi:hypothetical protein
VELCDNAWTREEELKIGSQTSTASRQKIPSPAARPVLLNPATRGLFNSPSTAAAIPKVWFERHAVAGAVIHYHVPTRSLKRRRVYARLSTLHRLSRFDPHRSAFAKPKNVDWLFHFPTSRCTAIPNN